MDVDKAAAIAALAGFQLYGAYTTSAPTLGELRECEPGDTSAKNKLMDTDLMIGGLAVFIGTAVGIISKDWRPLALLMIGFGAISGWFHLVQRAG